MARAPAHPYHHGDLRRALLDASLRIIAEEGARALTLREVARRVGVSQAAPYHHFADKDALLAAVAEEGFVELYEAMVTARDAAGSKTMARLRAIGEGYVRFAVRHPSHFKVMFGNLVDVPAHPGLRVAAERAFATLVEGIVEGQKAGQLRRGDPIQLAAIAWSTVHGLSMLWIDGALAGACRKSGPLSIEALATAASEANVRGLSAERA
jgi:AcrR family transcriptional regulator